MDTRTLNNLNTLHPKFQPSAINAWTEAQAAMPANVKIIVIQGLRTFAESDALYAQGRTAPGAIVTKAAAGQSYHNYGLAFDFAMVTNGHDDYVVGPNWMKVVSIMEANGMFWGGNFSGGFQDNPHFENRYDYNWRQLLALHNAGTFVPGTTYVQI
ncbi:MAG: cwlK [Mucilaginibacter sp.]|nr:cwlK [Mucilaginibacter sp.]